MRVLLFWTQLFLLTLQVSCSNGFGSWLLGKDSKSIVIQTLNMFDQTSSVENTTLPKLAGDWIFRRERLALLDANMRNTKSDVLVIQQASQRRGSPTDADDAILMAGALSGYDLDKLVVTEDPEKSTDVLLMTFLSPPFKFNALKYMGKMSIKTEHVAALVSVMEMENLPVVIVNVDAGHLNAPSKIYEDLTALMEEIISNAKICSNRIIVAGALPGDDKLASYQSFLDRYDLMDAAPEACLESGGCDTFTPANLIQKVVDPTHTSKARVDKVLVSKDADLLTAGLVFDKTYQGSQYAKELGFDSINISKRFGWSAEVRLQKCSPD